MKKKKFKRLTSSWSAFSESYPQGLRTYVSPMLPKGNYPPHFHSFSYAIHERGVGGRGKGKFILQHDLISDRMQKPKSCLTGGSMLVA